jgi:ABC-type amino acid transport substrate-binding protein
MTKPLFRVGDSVVFFDSHSAGAPALQNGEITHFSVDYMAAVETADGSNRWVLVRNMRLANPVVALSRCSE